MSLQDIFLELRISMAEKDILDRYAAAAGVVAKEERNRCLQVGDRVPPFGLTDPQRGAVDSSELLKRGPLVVNFYRGLWCPSCQTDLLKLDAIMQKIEGKGVTALAVAYGLSTDAQQRLFAAHPFRFSIVNDTAGAVAEQFGIRWSQEDRKLIQAELGLDTLRTNDLGPWISPIQARYVIAPDGEIIFVDTVFEVAARSEPADMLPPLSAYTTGRSPA
jgi:peroxiredoxin